MMATAEVGVIISRTLLEQGLLRGSSLYLQEPDDDGWPHAVVIVRVPWWRWPWSREKRERMLAEHLSAITQGARVQVQIVSV